MSDALAIVVVIHISRQQDQTMLDVGQDLRLQGGADFLQYVNAPGRLVGRNPSVRHASVNPAHFAPHPAQRVEGRRVLRGE